MTLVTYLHMLPMSTTTTIESTIKVTRKVPCLARWSFGLRMSKPRHGWVWMICKLHSSQNNTSVICMKGWEGMKLMKTFCLHPFISTGTIQEPVEWQLTLLTWFSVSLIATKSIPMILREGMHFELQAEAPLRVRFLIYERAVKDYSNLLCTAGSWCLGVDRAWVYCRLRSCLVHTNFGMLICSEFLRHVESFATILPCMKWDLIDLDLICLFFFLLIWHAKILFAFQRYQQFYIWICRWVLQVGEHFFGVCQSVTTTKNTMVHFQENISICSHFSILRLRMQSVFDSVRIQYQHTLPTSKTSWLLKKYIFPKHGKTWQQKPILQNVKQRTIAEPFSMLYLGGGQRFCRFGPREWGAQFFQKAKWQKKLETGRDFEDGKRMQKNFRIV